MGGTVRMGGCAGRREESQGVGIEKFRKFILGVVAFSMSWLTLDLLVENKRLR